MPYQPTERQLRCRFCDTFFGPNQDESRCTVTKPGVIVSADTCEGCTTFATKESVPKE